LRHGTLSCLQGPDALVRLRSRPGGRRLKGGADCSSGRALYLQAAFPSVA
jgi:hypothetical protein